MATVNASNMPDISTFGVRIEADTSGAIKFTTATQSMAQSAQQTDKAIQAMADRAGVSYNTMAARVANAGNVMNNTFKNTQQATSLTTACEIRISSGVSNCGYQV
jgi:hypothetical protein